ncbi:MAG: GNAT family N-acetyltransferase [Proteobacteria bacterium]|nr:GNAT family N-acetyltransferase [Pseudomonadota bacterium]
MDIRPYDAADLPGVLRLCEIERWPSFLSDPARAHRALTAPGVTTMVAMEGARLAGFAQMQSDGEIQAHLSLIAVDPDFRRRGLARDLIRAAFDAAGGLRVDLVTQGAEAFYGALPHFRMQGFRLYPDYTGPDRERPGVAWRDGRRVETE